VTDGFLEFDDILDFSSAEGDVIDFSNVTKVLGPDISDTIDLVESGGDTKMNVNTGANGWVTIARVESVTGLDAATMVADGSLIL
jgi:hypothetical protein